MHDIQIIERDVSKSELDRMQQGFDEHQVEHGNPIQTSTRYTMVALDGGNFIGCASAIQDNNWLYLSDLWLEKPYRKRGLGRALLKQLELRAAQEGFTQIYTWTAGYEAPAFYLKQEYAVFTELENYFSSGHSRVGLRKTLTPLT